MAYSVIKKPSDYFNTLLYSGNNTAQRQLTGVGFKPDLVWIKGRSGTYGAYGHFLFDAVRGVGKQIFTNNSNAESTNLNNLYSFNSDGFSLGQSGVDAVTNGSSTEFVSWNWLASNGTASNTNGSITSTVSVNTTSKFSIGKWLGNSSASATVGHGLGTTPSVIITKELNGTDWWHVWHKDLTNPNNMFLNTNSAQQAPGDGTISNVGSSTFGFQGATNVIAVNQSGINNVFYCFAEVKGFSKFGSYFGNGSSNGTFVYTGFKPAFIILKNTTNYDWHIFDNTRNGYNLSNSSLKTNSSGAEYTFDDVSVDLLSNGFKLRGTDIAINQNGTKHIFMAFAEEPLVGDNPATAR